MVLSEPPSCDAEAIEQLFVIGWSVIKQLTSDIKFLNHFRRLSDYVCSLCERPRIQRQSNQSRMDKLWMPGGLNSNNFCQQRRLLSIATAQRLAELFDFNFSEIRHTNYAIFR